MVVVAFLANVSNWIFYMGVLRGLGREQYAPYAAGMLLLGAFVYPVGALQALVSRSVAVSLVHGGPKAARGYLRLFAGVFGFLAAASSVVILAAGGLVSRALGIEAALLGPLLLAIFFVFLLPVVRGYLMGTERFWALGVNILVDTLGRLAVGLGLVWAGWGPEGALWGSAASAGLAVAGSLAVMGGDLFKPFRVPGAAAALFREGLVILVGFLSFYVFLQADLFVVRSCLASQESDLFAGVRKLGDAIVLLPLALVMVFQPRMASNHARGDKSHRLLGQSAGLVFVLSGGAALVFSLAPQLTLRILAGETFVEGAPILQALVWAALPTALGYVVMNYGLARKNSHTAWAYAGSAVLYLGALTLFHETLFQVLAVEALGATLALGALLSTVLHEKR